MTEHELKLISQYDAAAESYRALQASRNRDWGLGGVSTGIHDINLAIGGFMPKKVSTFAARSGIGKTGLLNSFIVGGSTVREGRRGAYLVFSWEMAPSLLVTREICRRAEITQGLIINGSKLLGDEKMKQIDGIYKDTSAYDVKYQTMSTDITVVDKLTREFVDECKRKEDEEKVAIQPIVLIDFIQMAKSEANALKTYQIQDFMVGAKNLVNETGAHVAALAQLRRAADDEEIPSRNNLADSKSIEDASDNLIFLHRPEYNNIPEIEDPATHGMVKSKNKMLIRTLKSRDFGTGDVLINCDIKYFRFWSQNHPSWDFDFHPEYNKKAFWLEHFGFKKNNEKQLSLDQN